jgi:hypothetical protein
MPSIKWHCVQYCTVYTQLCTQLRTHDTIFSAPISSGVIERGSTILSAVFSNRAFNPGAATGIPVSTEYLVLKGTQDEIVFCSNFEFCTISLLVMLKY